MVWKKHRTRIAKLILVLQIYSNDLYIFLRALFRIFFFIYFLYFTSYFLEISTTITSSTVFFHDWQIPSLHNYLESFFNSAFEKKILLWQIPFLIEKLKQESSYIQKYRVTVNPEGSCNLIIWPQKFICTINDTYILTQNGDLYEKELVIFNEDQKLKNISIHDSLIQENKISQYVQPLNSLLKNDYHIYISSINTIDLTFETHKKYIVRCNIKTYDIPQKYNETVLENMHLQSGLHLKKNEHLIFDMRFLEQVVMQTTKKKGGLL